MMHKNCIHAVFNSAINILAYVFLQFLITSKLFVIYSPVLLLISAIPAIILSVVYLSFLRDKNSKELICFSLISAVLFIFGIVTLYSFTVTLNLSIPLQRELSNADGFLIIISTSCYLLTSIILKVIFLICKIIQTKHKNTTHG